MIWLVHAAGPVLHLQSVSDDAAWLDVLAFAGHSGVDVEVLDASIVAVVHSRSSGLIEGSNKQAR